MTLNSDRSHHNKLNASAGRRRKQEDRKNAKESVIQLQERGKLCQGEIQAYKQFASDFDKVMKYNTFNEERLDKEQFCKILIDLAMVQQAKLNLHFYIEFVTSLPKVTLLWTILTKVNLQKQITQVKRGDIFTILAAILNLQVQDMLNTTDQKVNNTQNPLLYRNEKEEIVFVNYDDLQKFSIKFNSFRDNYWK